MMSDLRKAIGKPEQAFQEIFLPLIDGGISVFWQIFLQVHQLQDGEVLDSALPQLPTIPHYQPRGEDLHLPHRPWLRKLRLAYITVMILAATFSFSLAITTHGSIPYKCFAPKFVKKWIDCWCSDKIDPLNQVWVFLPVGQLYFRNKYLYYSNTLYFWKTFFHIFKSCVRSFLNVLSKNVRYANLFVFTNTLMYVDYVLMRKYPHICLKQIQKN